MLKSLSIKVKLGFVFFQKRVTKTTLRLAKSRLPAYENNHTVNPPFNVNYSFQKWNYTEAVSQKTNTEDVSALLLEQHGCFAVLWN